MNLRETGKDGVAMVGGDSIPFTNCSYDIEFGTSNSDYNIDLGQRTAYTSVHATGTLELDGSHQQLRSKFIRGNGYPRNPTLLVRGSESDVRFTNVYINNFGREFPGADKSTTSVEWEADNLRLI